MEKRVRLHAASREARGRRARARAVPRRARPRHGPPAARRGAAAPADPRRPREGGSRGRGPRGGVGARRGEAPGGGVRPGRARGEDPSGSSPGSPVPPGLSLAESFLFVEAGRARAARRRVIVEVELPALSLAPPRRRGRGGRRAARPAFGRGGEPPLGPRRARWPTSTSRRSRKRHAGRPRPPRRKAASLEEERQAAEKELAQRAFEGGGRAREIGGAARRRRGRPREGASSSGTPSTWRGRSWPSAATTTYGDFRSGLARASREILAACRLPYESLEFGEDLSVTVVARGGRPVTRADLAASVSTGRPGAAPPRRAARRAPAPRDGREGASSPPRRPARRDGRRALPRPSSASSSRTSSSTGRPSSSRATRSGTSAGWPRSRPALAARVRRVRLPGRSGAVANGCRRRRLN